MQLLTVGCGDFEGVSVLDVKHLWSWDVCPGALGHACGIDDVVLFEVEQATAQSSQAGGGEEWHPEVGEEAGHVQIAHLVYGWLCGAVAGKMEGGRERVASLRVKCAASVTHRAWRIPGC